MLYCLLFGSISAKCRFLEMIKFMGKELGQLMLDKYIIFNSD